MERFGGLTDHAVGVLLKEMVRRAIESIQAHQFSFEVTEKHNDFQAGIDFVTNADRAAQEIYVKMITECLPGFGIIAEEDNLRVESTLEEPIWVTVDPLDGTKAFMRRQSHGIGTMVALVNQTDVLAAYVGDANTREIYGFRPGSTRVHRISRYSSGTRLEIDALRPLNMQHALLHDEPRDFSEPTQRLFLDPDSRLFHSFEITRGSVGLEFSRLWKGEVGGVFLRPGNKTPWDFNPVLGISRHMGFRFLAIREGGLQEVDIPVFRDIGYLADEIVVVHESRIHEVLV